MPLLTPSITAAVRSRRIEKAALLTILTYNAEDDIEDARRDFDLDQGDPDRAEALKRAYKNFMVLRRLSGDATVDLELGLLEYKDEIVEQVGRPRYEWLRQTITFLTRAEYDLVSKANKFEHHIEILDQLQRGRYRAQ